MIIQLKISIVQPIGKIHYWWTSLLQVGKRHTNRNTGCASRIHRRSQCIYLYCRDINEGFIGRQRKISLQSLNCICTNCLYPESLFQLYSNFSFSLDSCGKDTVIQMHSEHTLSVLPSGSILSNQQHQFLAGMLVCSDHFLCHNCVILITSPPPAESPQVCGEIVFCISDKLPPRLLSLTGLHVALTDTTMNWVFLFTAGRQQLCTHEVSPAPEPLLYI